MASARDTLLEMGFPIEQVDRALELTGNQGLDSAMEWILAHAEELEQGTSASAVPSQNSSQISTNETADTEEPQANSLKCNDCGKLFKSQGDVEFHAAKSGHTNFSESTEEKKPLTEEEIAQQKQVIAAKLLEKRKEREEKEKQEALEREKHRIRAGKEMVNVRKQHEDDELRKAIEQRKRDKEEDKIARQKIRDQIEADKLARKAKQQQNTETVVVTAPPVETVSKPVVKKDYSVTRLQIRLLNGQSLTQTFGVKEQLSAVRLYVEMHRTDEEGPFSLMTSFPKKVFTGDDLDAPLEALGLVPSAVLIVTRPTS